MSTSNMRYERKYRIDEISFGAVEQIVRSHPASFRKAYPDRQVNNIYFDTPGLSTFEDNVAGVSDRCKYRVRWYGEIVPKPVNANFEIKIKSNQLGTKKTIPIGDIDLMDLETLTQKVNQLSSDINLLQPFLANAYQRAYYESLDGRFRITLDHQLKFCFPNYTSILNLNRFHQDFSGIIVELKYNESEDDNANQIMQYLPFRNTKNSKYVSGLYRVLN